MMNTCGVYRYEDGVTQSLLELWLRCRQACSLYLKGLRALKPSTSLVFGQLWHSVLERVHKAAIDKQVKDPESAIELGLESAKECEESVYSSGIPDQLAENMLLTFEVMWPEYCRQWHKDFTGEREWLHAEEIFKVSYEGTQLRGKRDGVLKTGDRLWIFETKTRSYISSGTIEQSLPINLQNLYYIFAWSIEHKDGPRIDGVIYDIIRKPQALDKDADPVDLKGKLSVMLKHDRAHFFRRYQAEYSDRRVRLFAKELSTILSEYKAWCCGRLATYRSTPSCEGRYVCAYLPYCASGRVDPSLYRWGGRLFEELFFEEKGEAK